MAEQCAVEGIDAGASIQVRVNGGGYASVASGTASGALALNIGANTVNVLVTAQDGTPKTYTVTVTRSAAAGTDATLSSLSLSSGTLSPAFAAATTAYTAGVGNTTTSITARPNATKSRTGTSLPDAARNRGPQPTPSNMPAHHTGITATRRIRPWEARCATCSTRSTCVITSSS